MDGSVLAVMIGTLSTVAERFNVGEVSLTWLRQPAQAWCDGQSVRVVAAPSGIFRAPYSEFVNDSAALALTPVPEIGRAHV